jgi:hypothetical protein
VLDELRTVADALPNRFLGRVQLAIGANISDFGKNDALGEPEVRACMERALDNETLFTKEHLHG